MRALVRGVALLGVTAACATPPRDPPLQDADVTVRKDQPFTLAAGQTAAVAGEPLRVTFGRVLEDSRCPPDVQCVQAGWAEAAVVAHVRPQRAETLALRVGGEPRSARYHDYLVELTAIDPVPLAGVERDSVRYTATLIVREP